MSGFERDAETTFPISVWFLFRLGLTKIPWTFRIRSPLRLHTHPSTKFTTYGMYVVNPQPRELYIEMGVNLRCYD
jgi:hypothetical protein